MNHVSITENCFSFLINEAFKYELESFAHKTFPPRQQKAKFFVKTQVLQESKAFLSVSV